MSAALELARQLIALASVTPDDAGCQALLAKRLTAQGFTCEPMRFGAVDNLWAWRGREAPLFVFAGHTDVVPAGPREQWQSDPFQPVVRNGMLYGRGAADMKGGLAAMVAGCERFLRDHPGHKGSIGFLITSDEEGPAQDGTRRVIETLRERGDTIDWCVVGEPSSRQRLGDTLRHGRRGSLNGVLLVRGVQGHVAYPDEADNPIHKLAPLLVELSATDWGRGDDDFPATSFQISNFNAGTGADNVIPGSAEVRFNFRYPPQVTVAGLRERVEQLLKRHKLDYTLDWRDSGAPFITRDGTLLDAARAAVQDVTGFTPEFSTGGGTSDGRFIAPAGAQVVELGPVNATIHKANEAVAVDDLDRLARIYQRLLERLLT